MAFSLIRAGILSNFRVSGWMTSRFILPRAKGVSSVRSAAEASDAELWNRVAVSPAKDAKKNPASMKSTVGGATPCAL